MTSTQLRMAVAASALSLRDLAEEVGLHASQISRIQKGSSASTETMRRLELFFTKELGYEFRQFNGTVCVCVPDDRPNE